VKLVYSSLEPIDKAEAIEKIFGEDAFEASEALIRAAHYIDDQAWLLSLIKQRLAAGDVSVQTDTLVALSALVRNVSDPDLPRIRKLLKACKANEALVGYCEDVEDDISRFH